jgi:RNA polymerase sigma factor FliA
MAAVLARADAPASPMPDDERRLWDRWRLHGDQEARQRLIALHLGYAKTVAAVYYARRIHNEIAFEDYHQIASLALVECIDRYDPARGAQFKTFAARRMHGAILDGIERMTEKQQQVAARQRLRDERLNSIKGGLPAPAGAAVQRLGPRAARAHAEDLFAYLAEVGIGIALSCLLDDTGMLRPEHESRTESDGVYQRVELRQLQRRVRELVHHLSPQERTVVSYHYLHAMPFDDIAVRLGLTKGRISQIHRSALQSLRALIHADPGCDLRC